MLTFTTFTQMGKEEVKRPLFADDMNLHVENFKKITEKKKLLELKKEFSKVVR